MNVEISIVIVNFNRAVLTLECVASIIEHTGDFSYEIIVVDNGSEPDEVQLLVRHMHQFRLVRLDRNTFFGEGSNIGAERAAGDYVLFLNNDVRVTANWLEPLLATLNNSDRAGAVGAKIVDPEGELLEAGCVIRPDGWGIQIGKSGMPLPASFADATRIADYCSGACLLMRRKVFLDLGGFDPIFDPAYFEDADLAIRLRSTGLFTYYCGAVTILHAESSTSTRVWSAEERQRHIETNHGRLLRRWGDYLRDRIGHDQEPEALAALHWAPEPPPSEQPATIVYSSGPLNADARSELLLRAAVALQDVCEVTFASDDAQSRCRIYSLGRHFGLGLATFRTRKFAEIDLAASRLIVTADAESDRPFLAPHLALPRDEPKLQHFMDRRMTRDVPRLTPKDLP